MKKVTKFFGGKIIISRKNNCKAMNFFDFVFLWNTEDSFINKVFKSYLGRGNQYPNLGK